MLIDGDAGSERDPDRRSYARSWIDAVVDTIAALPVPAWSPYVVAAGLLVVIEGVLVAGDGLPFGPFALYFAVAGVYAIAAAHYLREEAGRAFDRFRPQLSAPDGAEADRLRDRLRTLPAAAAAVVAGVAIAVAVAFLWVGGPVDGQMRNAGLATTPVSIALNLALYVLNWAATGALIHRVVHQARLIDRIARQGRIDLFGQAAFHGLSWLGARSIIALAALLYAPVFLLPSEGAFAAWWIARVGVGLLLGGLFLWPLLGIHGLLVAERNRLLGRSYGRWRAFYARLHERLAAGEHGVSELDRGELDSLEREQKTLRAIPTWPWAPEAIPTVVGSLLLPLILTVLVSILRQFLPG